MPIIATKGAEQTERKPVPAGTHLARCYQILDIGHVPEEYDGETSVKHKVRITWELPGELREFKEGEGERPMSISKEYTLSTNEKATLRQHLDSWRGIAMTDSEAMAFDIEAILGVPCLLNVIHKPNRQTGKPYATIASISPLVKGMVCPPQVNPSRSFSWAAPDEAMFDAFPDFLKDKLKQSEEYAALSGAKSHDDEVQEEPAPRKQEKINYVEATVEEINIDDIPF